VANFVYILSSLNTSSEEILKTSELRGTLPNIAFKLPQAAALIREIKYVQKHLMGN
jgi:hypothetical protein